MVNNKDAGGVSKVFEHMGDIGMLVIFVLLFASCSIFVDGFFSSFNMISLGLAVSTIGIIACTMLFCLASGDFDLSVGSVVACSGVTTAILVNYTSAHWGPTIGSVACVALSIIGGLLGGAAVGFFNGVIVAKCKINALITTLATMMIVRGLAYIFGKGKSIGVVDPNFYSLGTDIQGLPIPVIITIACFIFFGILLRNTTFGRNSLAIGGNEEAARLAGISVDKLKIIIFTMQGVMAAFAGIILASRMQIGDPKTGVGLELQVISACVLGGVSLSGGIGSMLFVITGVLIMGTVENAMNLQQIDSFWQYVVRGSILLAAVLFDRFKRRNS